MHSDELTLTQRFEKVRAGAGWFVDDVRNRHIHLPRRASLWRDLNESDRAQANELGHQLRLLTLDLALAMEHSPVLTKTDLRDIGRVGKRMCAALRFENYTGSLAEPGEQLEDWYDVRHILESGFDAIAAWVDLVPSALRCETAVSHEALSTDNNPRRP